MKEVALDFIGIKTLWELHELFKVTFHLPDYYGHNMDALWDCLHCAFEFPTTITLKNLSAIPQEMQPEVSIMLDLFHDLELEDTEVTVKIEDEGQNTDIAEYWF